MAAKEAAIVVSHRRVSSSTLGGREGGKGRGGRESEREGDGKRRDGKRRDGGRGETERVRDRERQSTRENVIEIISLYLLPDLHYPHF